MDRSVTWTDWARHKTIMLETRKRDGSWVATAVSLVVDDAGRAFFRTYDAAGKAKRLRNFPEVRVAPSTLLGKATGPARDANARMLDGDEDTYARAQLGRRFPFIHGRAVPWIHRRKGWRTQHYELSAT